MDLKKKIKHENHGIHDSCGNDEALITAFAMVKVHTNFH